MDLLPGGPLPEKRGDLLSGGGPSQSHEGIHSLDVPSLTQEGTHSLGVCSPSQEGIYSLGVLSLSQEVLKWARLWVLKWASWQVLKWASWWVLSAQRGDPGEQIPSWLRKGTPSLLIWGPMNLLIWRPLSLLIWGPISFLRCAISLHAIGINGRQIIHICNWDYLQLPLVIALIFTILLVDLIVLSFLNLHLKLSNNSSRSFIMFLIQQCQMSSGPHGPIFLLLGRNFAGNFYGLYQIRYNPTK